MQIPGKLRGKTSEDLIAEGDAGAFRLSSSDLLGHYLLSGRELPSRAVESSGRRSLETWLPLFLLFAVSITVLRWPLAWTSNEQNYFLLAHRCAYPDAYGAFDTVFDSSRGKWFGLLTFGWTIRLLGFESAHVLLGAITIALTAVGLAAVGTMLRLSAVASVSVLFVFIALGQSVIGGEWFVGAIETKAIAYSLGLTALAALAAGRIPWAASLVALSCYFHFLVGGFWLGLGAVFLVVNPERKSPASFLALAAICTAPLILALLLDVRDASALQPPDGMPAADTIYSIIRAPHHVAPFDGPRPWASKALVAALAALMISPLLWFAAAPRARIVGGQKLLKTLSVATLIIPAALVASWFDRHHGLLGKFYLFRPASPLLLLLLFACASLVQQRFSRKSSLHWWVIIGGSVGYLAMRPTVLDWPARESNMQAVIRTIRSKTAPGQIVLLDPTLDALGGVGPTLGRKLDRPMFVSWKFVPTNARDIYDWYHRLALRQRVFATAGCPSDPRIGALIVANKKMETKARCGTLIFQTQEYSVIALTHSRAKSPEPRA